jgi:hypothetical protein
MILDEGQAQSKGWKARMVKESDRDAIRKLKAADRKRLAELRQAIKDRRAKVKADARASLVRCREDRITARAEIKAWLAAERQKLRDRAHAEREELRAACRSRIVAIRASAMTDVQKARAEREQIQRNKKHAEDLAKIHAGRMAEHKHSSARERHAESDDRVRKNIEAALIPLWERVKRGIKGSDKLSRTEAFLQYVHESPGEVLAMHEARAAKQIAADIRAEREHYAAMKRENRYTAPAARALQTMAEKSAFRLVPSPRPEIKETIVIRDPGAVLPGFDPHPFTGQF